MTAALVFGVWALLLGGVVALFCIPPGDADRREAKLRRLPRVAERMLAPKTQVVAGYEQRPEVAAADGRSIRCYAVKNLVDLSSGEARAAERRGECEVIRLPKRDRGTAA